MGIDSRSDTDLIRGRHGRSCTCTAYQLFLPACDSLGVNGNRRQTKRPNIDRICRRGRRYRVPNRIAQLRHELKQLHQ